MCGRYVLVMGDDGVAQLIPERDMSPEWRAQLESEGRILKEDAGNRSRPTKPRFANYNIAPTQYAPVVVNRTGKRELEFPRWGFVPSWWKKEELPKIASFNARDDRLKESPFWRNALNHYRCMIPATGFYEWRKQGRERLPYYIHRADNRMMAFAGIYSFYTNPANGMSEATFAIITTPTNRFMEPLHDRIPLVLGDVEDELWSVWLDPQSTYKSVERLVTSREWPEMDMHRVSTDVNPTGKKRYVNDPRLIKPVEEQGALVSRLIT